MTKLVAIGALLVGVALGDARPLYAQATVADLQRLLEQQQRLLDEQNRRIEGLTQEMSALRARIDGNGGSSAPAVSGSEQSPPAGEGTGQRAPDMPQPVVTGGDFPGSLRVPGTEAALKIGGQARMTLVHTLAPLGTDDRFVTSSIPVIDDNQVAGDESRTVYSPTASRINLDLRTPSLIGPTRTFMEADFAGPSNSFRLRHAYIQTTDWIFGQTWSTFTDRETEPIGIDFEGLNAISLFRQPQVRFTRPLPRSLALSFSIENPDPDLTGAVGVPLIPDFITRLRWQPSDTTVRRRLGANHLQGAILVRQLRGELENDPTVTLGAGGFGAMVAGVAAPLWDVEDRIKFAVNAGWGIGRYITDLGTLGGQDAVYDSVDGSLRSLAVTSGYIGYEKMWRPTFTSAFTYGIVNVDNLDIQPADALKRTQRTSINLTFSPIPQADIVVEFLFGTRVNKDNHRGTSSQIQTGWTYRF